VRLEVASLSLVDGDGDGLHEAELGWSEFNGCLMADGARARVKCSHVSLCSCKLDVKWL
jgi:hypothetical protein